MPFRASPAVLRVLASAIASGTLLGCTAAPSASSVISVSGPNYDEFVGGGENGAGVHAFLENQCGTLDCHGETGRPLRLYSVDGLRAPNSAGLVSGSGLETSAELYSNFLSVISLQPEETDRVVAGQDPPTELLLLQKPMGSVSHKGGTRIVIGDAMYRCLTSWFSAPAGEAVFDADACTEAAAIP